MLQCVGGHGKLSEVLWVVLRKSDKQVLMSKRKKEENTVALFPLGFMFLADGQGEQNICGKHSYTSVATISSRVPGSMSMTGISGMV